MSKRRAGSHGQGHSTAWHRPEAGCKPWYTDIAVPVSGCVFLANSAFTQACVMWVTLIPLLFRFHHYARARYGEAISHM